MTEVEQAFPDDFARTAASRFRSATDISVTNSLYHYYALMTGRAVATRQPRVRYVQTTLTASLRRMERLANRTDLDMFCLNDGGETEVPEQLRTRVVRASLDRTAIEDQGTATHFDRVAGKCDDAFDQVEIAIGMAEHDYVAAIRNLAENPP